MPLDYATQLAAIWVERLHPYCERIEVAGSVRRRKAWVGDIEIVAIPKVRINIFGESKLEEPLPVTGYLEGLVQQGSIQWIKNGLKYKQFTDIGSSYKPNVDLFLVVPPAQWGVIFLMRTGSADFSHNIVKLKQIGGHMPASIRQVDGHLEWVATGEHIHTPEEADYFKAIDLEWVEPTDR